MKKSIKLLMAAFLIFSTVTGFAIAENKIPEHFIWKESKWKPAVYGTETNDFWWKAQKDGSVKFYRSNNTEAGKECLYGDYDTKKYYGFEGTLKKISGPLSGSLGFYFCTNIDSQGKIIHGYFYSINADGKYIVTERDKGKTTILQKWTKNDAIKQGLDEENVLKVQFDKDSNSIELYINDILVKTIENPKFINGYVFFHTYNEFQSESSVENLYKLNKVYSEAKGKKEIAAAIQQEEDCKATK